MITKENSDFHDPRAGVLVLWHSYISDIENNHYYFKNLLYSQAQIRLTEYKGMMIKEGSFRIVNFMTPRARVLVLGCGLAGKRG